MRGYAIMPDIKAFAEAFAFEDKKSRIINNKQSGCRM